MMTTQDIIDRLQPCPFCGSKADGSELLTGFSLTSTIYCSNKECDASAPFKNNNGPVWNKRSDKQLEEARYDRARAEEDKESMATSLIELFNKYRKLENKRKDKMVFECDKYSIYADETGFMIKTSERQKWSRLEHYLNYDLELEAEVEDLKNHIRKWEEFYASCTIGGEAS